MLPEIGGEVTPGRLKRRRYQGNPEWQEWAYDMWNIAGKKYYLLLLGVCISACYKMIWSRKEQKETKEYLNLSSASTHSISGVATSTLGCVPKLSPQCNGHSFTLSALLFLGCGNLWKVENDNSYWPFQRQGLAAQFSA